MFHELVASATDAPLWRLAACLCQRRSRVDQAGVDLSHMVDLNHLHGRADVLINELNHLFRAFLAKHVRNAAQIRLELHCVQAFDFGNLFSKSDRCGEFVTMGAQAGV